MAIEPKGASRNTAFVPGLVRHAALVPLSREHHGVLVQAQALKGCSRPAVAANAVEVALEAYLRFHDAEMLGHMDDEERVLLPLTRDADTEGAARILAEHERIEALTAELRASRATTTAGLAALGELGQLLDDHVRFEERSFFMRVQAALDASQLAALGAALEQHRAERGAAPGCVLPARAEPR